MLFVACICFCFSTEKKQAVSPEFGKIFLSSLFSPTKGPTHPAKSASSASLSSTSLDSISSPCRPHSESYRRNLLAVDRGARLVSDLCDRHWRSDGRTAFVFTADHGMTDWGSHGTGEIWVPNNFFLFFFGTGENRFPE